MNRNRATMATNRKNQRNQNHHPPFGSRERKNEDKKLDYNKCKRIKEVGQ